MPRVISKRSRTDVEPDEEDLASSKLRLVGVLLLCLKVALVPLVFDLSLDVAVGVPKALLSHSLSFVLAGILAGLSVKYGFRPFVWSWLHIPVLAFLAANVASTLVAANQVLALYGAHGRMLGLGTIADWVVLYFAVVWLVRTEREATALVVLGFGASALVLAYELVQLVGLDPFSWNFVGSVNPFSTLGQPTILAHYLTILAMGAFAFAVVMEGLRVPVRALLLLYAVALVAGAGATGTRSAAVGFATGSAVLIVLNLIANPSRRARATSLVAAGFAVTALVALLILSPVGSRLAATIDALTTDDSQGDLLLRLEPSAAARVALYAIALQMVQERPLLGYGPDNFAVGVPRYRTANEPPEIRSSVATSAHSWVGYVATGSGVIGLVAFLAVVGLALGLALRRGSPAAMAAAAMLAAFLGSGLTTVTDIGSDWLLWANLGAIAAVTARAGSPNRPSTGSGGKHTARRRTSLSNWNARTVAAMICPLIGLVACLVTGPSAFEASRAARLSDDSRLIGRVPPAIEHALRATRSDPRRAEYWHDLGPAYVAAARWMDASAAFERASELAPYDVRNIDDHATAQLLLANSGDAGAGARAVALVDRAISIDPNNPQAQLTRAVAMQVRRNLTEAVRSIEKAMALDPTSRSAKLWVAATQIYLDSGRPTDAARVARQGIELLGPTPSSILVRYELARALVGLGQPSEALAVLDFALSIRPYGPAEQLRAQIRAGLGQ